MWNASIRTAFGCICICSVQWIYWKTSTSILQIVWCKQNRTEPFSHSRDIMWYSHLYPLKSTNSLSIVVLDTYEYVCAVRYIFGLKPIKDDMYNKTYNTYLFDKSMAKRKTYVDIINRMLSKLKIVMHTLWIMLLYTVLHRRSTFTFRFNIQYDIIEYWQYTYIVQQLANNCRYFM